MDRTNNVVKTSIVSKLLASNIVSKAFGIQAAAIISDPRWQTYAFGIDISGIQKVIDWPLLKASGVDFVTARCGHGRWTYNNISDPAVAVDTTFASHCQGAWDVDMPFGAYFVLDPTVPQDPADPMADRQIKAIMYALKNKVGKSVSWFALDTEIYLDANAKTITNKQISENGSRIVSRMHDIYPNLKIGVYTGNWFIDQYAPAMKVWMDNYAQYWGMFGWCATYPTNPNAPKSVTAAQWSDFRGKYAPYWPVNKSFPWMGNNACKIWQYSGDKFTAPGHFGEVKNALSAIDCNFFDGTLAQMRDWCSCPSHGAVVTPTPDPEPLPVKVIDVAGIKAALGIITTQVSAIDAKLTVS